MGRTYSVGVNMMNGHLTLTVNLALVQIPFNVWRDVHRFCICSYSQPGKEVFEIRSEHLEKAKKILEGALFVEAA